MNWMLILLALAAAIWVGRRYSRQSKEHKSLSCAIMGHCIFLSDEKGEPVHGWVRIGEEYHGTCGRCGQVYEPLTLTRDMLP